MIATTDFIVESTQDLIQLFEVARMGQPAGDFIFRGQAKPWDLKTSLERACNVIEQPAGNRLERASAVDLGGDPRPGAPARRDPRSPAARRECRQPSEGS